MDRFTEILNEHFDFAGLYKAWASSANLQSLSETWQGAPCQVCFCPDDPSEPLTAPCRHYNK